VFNNLHATCQDIRFVLQPWSRKLVLRFLGIVLQRQLSDLGVERLHIDRGCGRRPTSDPKLGRRCFKLRFPCCDLIGVNVECSASWAIGAIALHGGQSTFALKAGEWFRRGRLLMVFFLLFTAISPLSAETPLNRPVQISEPAQINSPSLFEYQKSGGGNIHNFLFVELLAIEPDAAAVRYFIKANASNIPASEVRSR